MQIIAQILNGFVILLFIDVSLAALFGRRYLRWLLSLFPGFGDDLQDRIENIPTAFLICLGLLELALAVALLNLSIFLQR